MSDKETRQQYKELLEEINDVAKSGDVEKMQEKIAEGFEVRKDGHLAIYEAIMAGQKEMATFLIRHGADPDAALYPACAKGWFDIVQDLVENKKAEVNPKGGLPLIWGAKHGHSDIIEYLIKKGADVNVMGGRAIILAVNNCKEEAVRVLVENGANVNPESGSPYDVARACKYIKIAEFLHEHGAVALDHYPKEAKEAVA